MLYLIIWFFIYRKDGERLWCIRKFLCTVHKSQHNCFLHPKWNQTKQNKTNQTRNLQSHHQHRRSSSSLYRNAKIILLWKWFLWVVLQNHFAVEMVSRIFNLIINTVVHHHHRTGMPKPFCCGNGFQNLQSHHQHRRSSSSLYRNAKTFCCGKPLDVLNCFQQFPSHKSL